MRFRHAGRLKDLLQTLTAKGSGMTPVHVIRDPGKIGPHMILAATRKILQSQLILDGDDDAPARLYVGLDDL